LTRAACSELGDRRYENERPDIEALVPYGLGAVLDVGCGRGLLGAALKHSRGARRVVGIEIDAEAAKEARSRLDEVYLLDVEREPLPFDDGSFDCIVYGDVLEHLVDPWRVLHEQRRLLVADGIAIVSIPNIAFWHVVLDLVRGRWEYTTHGTLDSTHLRFFTRRSIEELLAQAGFRVERVATPITPGGKSWWLNRLSGGRLEHLLVWRYVFVVRAA
jgi:methionine biosynthesis protein MetW